MISLVYDPVLTASQWNTVVHYGKKLNFKNPHLREGQALYLAIRKFYPVIADNIHNTHYDMFYKDSNIYNFKNYKVENGGYKYRNEGD